ncbi:hypothetical protein [Absidia glauca]|uniref:Uncharacterized protein n=1 Tax=Absidia glauca TaxID=4829 RepID=A0A170AMA2_ABSGL|nr:hypothetical protein [Absidia glauca]
MYRDVKTVTPCSGWTPGVAYIDKLVWSPDVPKELKLLFEPNQSTMEQEKKKINNANARSSQRTNSETTTKDATDSETAEEWKDIAGRTLNFLNEHVNLRGSDFPSIKEQRRNIKIKKITDSSHPCCGAYGLVAAQNLAPRQLILDYLGVVEYKSYSSSSDYVLRYGIDLSIDAEKCGNEARFFNDFRGVATGPNVCFLNYLDERTERIKVGVFVLGNKKIKKGEELIKPPRQAHEWSYFSHRQSIGKALSSPGIRSNQNTHINRGSSARMAGKVCANVDQIRRQGRWNNTTINGAYLTNLPRELVQSLATSPHMPLQEVVPGDPIRPTVAEIAFVQVIMMFRKTSVQDSVLMMELHPCYPIWQHSNFSDPAYLSSKRDILQIEAQEHDPAHTLLQQCATMHSRFQTPIGYKIYFFGLSFIFAPSSPRHYFFASTLSFSSLHDVKRTNERANERTNGNSPLLTSCSSFAYHY